MGIRKAIRSWKSHLERKRAKCEQMLCEQWGGKRVDFRHTGMRSKNETQVGMHGVTGTEVAKEVGTCFHCKGYGGKNGYLHPSRAEAP